MSDYSAKDCSVLVIICGSFRLIFIYASDKLRDKCFIPFIVTPVYARLINNHFVCRANIIKSKVLRTLIKIYDI